MPEIEAAHEDLFAEYKAWRLGVRNDWDAFQEYRSLKAKADAWDGEHGQGEG